MSQLSEMHCEPCEEGANPLPEARIRELLAQLDADWEVVDGHHLSRTFRFPDFARGLTFVNRVGRLAEAENHHPDLLLSWGRVRVDLWTHVAKGLTENDFVLAAKIDRAWEA